MPANFADIAAYHHQEADRHYALAQAARNRGCLAEAEFEAGLAARWDEAAQEQKTGMRQLPTCPNTMKSPHCPPSPPPAMPLAVVCLLAVLRGVKRIAASIRHPMVKQGAPLGGLPLR